MTDQPEEFDLLVVGGGKAGKTLSMDVARSGQRVAMVERGMIGGSCINVACIPTKALVTSARAARQLRDASALGLAVEGGRVDIDLLRAHKQDVVEGMVAANRQQFLDSGLHLVIGEARFVGPRTVRVALATAASDCCAARDVVINTGTRPPPAVGARDGRGRGAHQRRVAAPGPAAGPAGGARRRHRRGGVRADVRVVRQRGDAGRGLVRGCSPARTPTSATR